MCQFSLNVKSSAKLRSLRWERELLGGFRLRSVMLAGISLISYTANHGKHGKHGKHGGLTRVRIGLSRWSNMSLNVYFNRF